MESAKFNCSFILLFTFAAIIPSLNANIGIFDKVWQKRAEEAKLAALKAYKPNLSAGLLNQHPLKVLNGNKSNTTTQVVKGNAHLTKNITKPSGAQANQQKVKPNLTTKNITKPSGEKVKPNLTKKNCTKPSAPLSTGKNSTRRTLANKVKYTGPCKATNPIDKCWRCQPLWERNRKKLADCSIGFGRGTTGGKAGRIYIVTSPSDDDVVNPRPGTLRHAVIQKEPLWIIFKRGMIIRLKQELIMQSHKTIDGRGAKVHIAYGAGITIQFVKNIIIHNIYIHDIKVTNGGLIRDSVDHIGLRTKSDGDGITIFGSTNIWLDHLSMYRCDDGIIDAIEGSTAITISNCHWTDHDKVLLFGARDTNVEDDYMQITVVYNHFGKRLVQRMPRVRSGFIHVVNNDYTHWNMYAIGGSHHATIISEGNRFIATTRPEFKQVTHRDAPESEWRKWTWRSQGDLFKKGAFFVESGDPNGVNRLGRLDGVVPKKAKAVKSLTRFAGVIGGCRPGVPC